MQSVFSNIPRKTLFLFGAIHLALVLCGWGMYEYLQHLIHHHFEADLSSIATTANPQLGHMVRGEVQQLTFLMTSSLLFILLTSTALMVVWLRQIIQKSQLEIKSNQLAATIEAIPDLLLEMDTEGRYYAVQGTHDHLLAASEQTLLSHTVREVMPRESADVLMAALREAAEHGSTHGVQISVDVPGGVIWFELSIARKATPPGQAQRLIVLSRNITEYKRIESELKQHRDHLQEMVDERTSEADHARWEAEQANQAKSMFLANMSHELRTPMHAVLSFATVGIERSMDVEGAAMEKCHHYFDRIRQSGNRLLSLLNDLLDLSKLEAGKMVLDIHTYNLRDLVCEICDEMATLAENKGMTFDFAQVPSEMEINCDRMRIGQVLSNLLSNAIKFSPAIGTLHISATRVSLPGQGAGVTIRVQDEGIGIPPEELKSIFDNFKQSSRTASNAGGTGLGLSISREIVELHGGAIHAENNPESGAALIFTLPLHQAEMGVVDFGGGL